MYRYASADFLVKSDIKAINSNKRSISLICFFFPSWVHSVLLQRTRNSSFFDVWFFFLKPVLKEFLETFFFILKPFKYHFIYIFFIKIEYISGLQSLRVKTSRVVIPYPFFFRLL